MNRTKQLNELVLIYQKTKRDEVFTEIYQIVSQKWNNLEAVSKSVRSTVWDVIAVYEDALIESIRTWQSVGNFEHYLNVNIVRRRCDLYRKSNRLRTSEVLKIDGAEAATFEIADEFNLEEYVTAKKRADQRQLIDSLLDGADETTTAIVEAFLNHPKPTATAIAKELGWHHSKVLRALTRLAAKFDPKQHGDYTDYLVAL
ncbi:sigma-70 family RNA polymerase sigma factor [Robertmurraya sp. DFI.2.37]|uniref:sigma-70 family RNA polymerase sigma factor n=1 Tax=Robertmurraya sp. DFI.2.37 TaxID=3031819 RepID=UPI00124633A2|nr:sigma-70 family RNA polymerase sigma factor [Robertmurraya sp. DFI.2.37]MDF1510690.1 sigma-70 family RNA polymerase sigma factor [Robertmurraya sp. DFI.2.37]